LVEGSGSGIREQARRGCHSLLLLSQKKVPLYNPFPIIKISKGMRMFYYSKGMRMFYGGTT
jgi:hypothetical protein